MSADWFDGFSKIKLGPGVIGKSNQFGIAAVLGLSYLASHAPSEWIPHLVLLIVLGCGAFIWRVFKFADSHPDHAILEGADLARLREIEMAAKDTTMIDVTPSANTSPPDSLSGPPGEAVRG